MKRFFNLFLGAMAMLAVALLSAFIAMRLAIHGREVVVPNLAGLALSEASKQAASRGLSLTLENKFYSPNTPPGRILAQSPAPGEKVRRSWSIRVTESLGPQSVSIPNLVGLSERAAAINLRQLSLDLGTIARIPAPGDPGIVLAQSPPANATGVDSPRVSLLLSDPLPLEPAVPLSAPTPAADTSQPAAEPTAPTAQQATTSQALPIPQAAPAVAPAAAGFPMPSLIGLTLSAAYAHAAADGLHVVSIQQATSSAKSAAKPAAETTPSTTPGPKLVVSQTPAAGKNVVKGAEVHLTLE